MIKNKHAPVILAVSVAVLVILIGVVNILPLTNSPKYDRYDRKDFIDLDAYQAVFLTNDQIYFGHLRNIESEYMILYDVYYVKINESGGQLVKLGAIEPHGPQDKMIISKNQILFWENLKFDSPVVETIQSMQLK